MKEMIKSSASRIIGLTNPIDEQRRSNIMWIYAVWIVAVFVFWYVKDSVVVPKPHQILTAFGTLFANGFARDLIASLSFTMKCMALATGIAFVMSFVYLVPAARPLMALMGKSRFLSTAGFTVLFAVMTPDAASQKQALLVFCITVFQVVSFMDIMTSVPPERIDYCTTMKMKPWRVVWEEMILAKRSDMLVSVRQNFAIAWVSLPMVESISRVDGGIGIVLEDLKRHFKYDQIFAVQIIVLSCGILIDSALEKARKMAFGRWAQ